MTRTRPIRVRLFLGIAVLAVALAPAAQAYPVEDGGARIAAEQGYVPFLTDFPKTTVEVPQYGLPRALPSDYGVIVREVPAASPGFEWQDAGVGLAAGAALGLLGVAGALALRRKDDGLTPSF